MSRLGRRDLAVIAALGMVSLGSDCQGRDLPYGIKSQLIGIPLATLTASSPEAYYDITVSGDEAAFWDLSGVEQTGSLVFDGSITNNSVSASAELWYTAEAFFEGTITDITQAGETDHQDIYAQWFSGVCSTAGGCSVTGRFDILLLDPFPDQSVVVDLAVQAELFSPNNEIPEGDPELTIVIDDLLD
jgi:hypothetical protein